MGLTTATWSELGHSYNTIAFILGHIVLGVIVLVGMIFLFLFLLNLYRVIRKRKPQPDNLDAQPVDTRLTRAAAKFGTAMQSAAGGKKENN